MRSWLTLCAPIPPVPGGVLALVAKGVVEGLAAGAAAMLSSGRWSLPPLYKSGVRYALEPNHGKGTDEFAMPPVVYQRRWGDCDDLVIWRIAELRAAGVAASCRAVWVGSRVHVTVRHPNGQIEDPAKNLMR